MHVALPRAITSALLWAAILAVSALPASAQYMYLDANGDGVNSSADVVAPTGTTTLEVWLKTDTNRDGTPAVCPTGEELTINSYEFILHAANGQMNWLTYTNLQPDMVTSFGLGSNGTDYHNGFGGGVILPRGTYHLGTLQVSVALGTPSLSIVAGTPLSGGYLTEFGSQCLAQDQDNTMKLGLDWFDVDGVAYGGSPQAPPVLEAIADMTLDEGAVATQTITATDADLQPLQFTKVSGPPYMTLTTTETGAGTGTAHATITLAPGPLDQGVTSSTVRVTDGITTDEKSFGIRVVGANTSPPVVVAREALSVPVGIDFYDNVSATDPDGERMVLSMVQCPSFVLPYLFGPTDGFGNVGGSYYGRPASGDVGTGFVIFEATDGLLSGFARTKYTVTGAPPPAPPPPDLFGSLYTVTELAGPATGIAMGDFDGDGDDDAAIASAAAGAVSIYASDRRGGLDLIQNLPAASPRAIVSGDVDGDGDADVVYVDDRSGDVVVLGGPLTGAIPTSQTIHVGSRPAALALGDIDRDGWLDAVVALRGGDAVAILMNDGAGLLRAPSTLATSPDPMAVALGDYNGDTWLDVAVVCRAPARLNTFLNAGDGTLQSVVSMPLATFGTPLPTAAVALSLGTDARIDLVIADENGGNRLYTSLGDGTFSSGTTFLGSVSTAIAAVDLVGSGRMGFVAGIAPSPNNFPFDQERVYLGVYAPGTAEPLRFSPQPGGRITGIATGDVDADGSQDVISVQSWTIKGVAAVYRNQGGGELGSALVTGTGGAYNIPALADFNNDGHLDLAFGSETYLGKGDGKFEGRINSPTSYGEGVLKAADLNQDGRQDVVFVPSCCNDIYLSLGDGTGHFVPAPGLRSNLGQGRGFDLGDLNEDGFPDLVIGAGTYSGPTPGRLEVWLGRGDGTFAPPTLLDPVQLWNLALSDYDSDGHLDIVYSDPQFRVFRGHGDGSFDSSDLLFSAQGGTFDLGDLNRDGRVDLLTSANTPGFPLRAALQASDHSFVQSQPFWTLGGYGYGVTSYANAILDANGDGNADVLSTFATGLALGLGTGTANVSRRRVFGPAGGYKFVADMNEDGWPDIVTAGGNYELQYSPIVVFLNQSEMLNRRLARAFLTGGSKTIPVGVTGRDLCLRVEPVGGSYDNADIDLSSIVMKSVGTGSVNQIVAIPAKKLVLGDSDGNGVAEIPACFSSADLGRLFSKLTGRQEVPVVLSARLEGGGRMYSEVTLTIVHTGPSAAPSLSPNPLNPSGVFRFVTTRAGQARIQLFDVQGRLVRSVVDRELPAGTQEVPFDGKDGGGRSLASGIYFARVETTEGQYRMRVAIVK